MANFDITHHSSPFINKSRILSELIFFALGLSVGLVIGLYDLDNNLPFTAFSSTSSSVQGEQPLPPPLPPIPQPNLPPPLPSIPRPNLLPPIPQHNLPSSLPPIPQPNLPPPLPPIPQPSLPPIPQPSLPPLLSPVPLEEEEDGSSLRHNMSDDELLRKASSMVDQLEVSPRNSVPKVAFMFLTRGPLPLAPLWELFLKSHKGYYSIYIHAHPSYNDPFPQDSIFHGRFIPSQEVQWGSITMVSAERRLLANAFLDPSNQRFVLLSESCIPIFNFTTIYNYLMGSNLSFLDSQDRPSLNARGRYNPRMYPIINVTDWRKGAQWFEVHRDLAIHIVSDRIYFDVFKEHFAYRYSDEHYLPTLVNIKCPSLISNRTITFADWRIPDAHPASFGANRVSEELLDWIRFGSNCTYNGVETRTCFLFARKFLPSSLEPLLRFLIFDP